MLANHTLAPVAVAQLPQWAKDFVKGQEDAFCAQQQVRARVCVYVCVSRHLNVRSAL